MNSADINYKSLLREILDYGNTDFDARPRYKDGKEANTLFITQQFEKYDISKGEFPIPTLRNTAIKSGIAESLWIYQLQSNKLSDLKSLGVHWWDEWDIGNGSVGQRYGATVKRYDLMNKLLHGLEHNPFGRRHVINLLQEVDLGETDGLYPCAFQTMWSCRKVDSKMFLDMHLDQRSNDYITAGFINKIQYVALQMMVACHLGYEVGVFSHYVHNLHIYDRHIDAAKEILERKSLETKPFIKLNIKPKTNFYDIKLSDFSVHGIEGIEKIKSPLEIAI